MVGADGACRSLGPLLVLPFSWFQHFNYWQILPLRTQVKRLFAVLSVHLLQRVVASVFGRNAVVGSGRTVVNARLPTVRGGA